jgi:hypothetical protein
LLAKLAGRLGRLETRVTALAATDARHGDEDREEVQRLVASLREIVAARPRRAAEE